MPSKILKGEKNLSLTYIFQSIFLFLSFRKIPFQKNSWLCLLRFFLTFNIVFQAYGASHEDFGIILHMDRGPHHIMNYAKDFDRLPILEQEGLALLVSHLGSLE